MEEVNIRFQHISEQIFGYLGNESLANCKKVCRTWNNFIDGQKFFHARIILETATRNHKVERSWFQVLKKCNTKTVGDLRTAVKQLYQESGIFASSTPVSREYNQLVWTVSPLHVAAAFGQLTLFNDILQRVENKFPSDGLGRSTLHYAAINDCLNIYESIVAIKGNIFSTLGVGHSIFEISTPLEMAVKHSSLKVCRFIVEKNQVPTHYTNTALHKALHIAAWKGRLEIYKIIMEKVADKNPLFSGCTPLHLTAVSGNLEMCRLILENVNDKSPVSDYGITPKDVAKNHHHLEIVKLFS